MQYRNTGISPVFALIAAAAMLSLATPAQAYIGPGLGAAAIVTVLGTVMAFFLAIFAVIYYPLKRAFKKRKAARRVTSGTTAEPIAPRALAEPGSPE